MAGTDGRLTVGAEGSSAGCGMLRLGEEAGGRGKRARLAGPSAWYTVLFSHCAVDQLATRPHTAVSSMLDRPTADDHEERERLTTFGVGRDGPGCKGAAFQLGNTEDSLRRAWHSSPRGAVRHTAAHRGEQHARSTNC